MKRVSWLVWGLFLIAFGVTGCTSLPQSHLAAGPEEFWIHSQYHINDPHEFDPDLDFD